MTDERNPFDESVISRRELLRRAGVLGGVALVPGVFGASASAMAVQSLTNVTWGLSGAVIDLSGRTLDEETESARYLGLEGLLTYDAQGRLAPLLATSWRRLNPTTIEFELRRGVKFWDGSPLTAADVVYSHQQQISTKFGGSSAGFYSNFASVTTPRPDIVRFNLKRPDANAIYLAAVTGIVSKRFWKAHPKDIGNPGVLTMGTGPMRFTSFTPNQSVVLERNPAYWGTKVLMQKLTLLIIPDPSARLLALRAGKLDGAFQVPLGSARQWDSTPGVQVLYSPSLGLDFLIIKPTASPWNDLHVRRAIAHSVDRKGLLRAVLGGRGELLPSIIPVGQFANILPTKSVRAAYAAFPDFSFNLAKAKAELAQSSVPQGFSASLSYPDHLPALGLIAQNLSRNLNQIGIKLSVREIPKAQWGSDLGDPEVRLQIATFTPDYPDAQEFATALIGRENFGGYVNAKVQKLVGQAAAATKPAVRARLLLQALKLSASDVPYVPVFSERRAVAVREGLTYKDYARRGAWYQFNNWAKSIRSA